MKRLLFFVGRLSGPVALAVLAVAVILSLKGIQDNTAPSPQAFQSPIETPSTFVPTKIPGTASPTSIIPVSPHPATDTPTPGRTPSVEPTRLLTATPDGTDTPSPTPIPMVITTLPPGQKIIYKQYDNSTMSIWAASASHPELRQMLFTISDPQRFGIRAGISYDETRIAYTVLPSDRSLDPFAADLRLANMDGSQDQLLATQVDIGRFVNYPLWSPVYQWIAFSRQTASEPPFVQTINALSLATGQELTLVSADESTWLWPLDWSPDGRYFYYIRGTTRAELWRVDLGYERNEYLRLVWDGTVPRCYFLSRNGEWLLCTVLESRDPVRYAVIVVPITSPGEVEILISGATNDLYNPIWYVDSREITFNLSVPGSEQVKLQTIDLQTRFIRTMLVAEGMSFTPRSWSPDGQWLAVQQFPEDNHDLLVMDYDGIRVNRVPRSEGIEIIKWITRDLPSPGH